MAITKITADLSFISKLDNEPSEDSGMTPSVLKARFDAGSNALKAFINDTLIPEVEAALLEKLGAGTLQSAVNTALSITKESGQFDGPSAYESAVKGGYTGTEAEFYNVLTSGIRTASAVLSASGWSGTEQTVSVTGVTASNTVIVTPTPTSQAGYVGAGVACIRQGSGTLTFTCYATPTADIAVNILISGVAS